MRGSFWREKAIGNCAGRGARRRAVQVREGQLMQQGRKAGINSRCSGRGKELALWNWQLGIYTQTL